MTSKRHHKFKLCCGEPPDGKNGNTSQSSGGDGVRDRMTSVEMENGVHRETGAGWKGTTAEGGVEGGGRGKWSSSTEFMLTCIGYSVGLGNVWRFPYLCYKNGGGAFLIAYIVMICLIGMPMLFMEFSLGQFFGIGSMSIFKKVCPILQGVGVSFAVLNGLVSVYYNVIIAMSLYYIFGSVDKLPWATCGHYWNTENCVDETPSDGNHGNTSSLYDVINGTVNATTELMAMTSSVTSSMMSSMMSLMNSSLNADNGSFLNSSILRQKTSPTDEYFRYALLNEQADINIENIGSVRWHLCLCLVLAWILVVLFVSRGIQSTGKVAYFTATFPYVMLTVLVARGATLSGAREGIIYLFTPNWSQLANPEVWFEAATQLFYSTCLAWGGMITMSSYNSFKHNCFRDMLIINGVSFVTSIYAGSAVFAIIGHMAEEYGIKITDVVSSGPGLAFIAYPRALSLMPLAPLWTALFFFMLFLLGVGTQMVLIETVVTGFVDEFPRLGLNKCIRFMTTLCICLTFFVAGIAMTTQGGMYVLQLMDHYSASFGVLIIAIAECVAIGWVYGARRLSGNIREMVGRYPATWWRVCWTCLTPLLLTFILVFRCIKYQPVTYKREEFPIWADVLGWCLALSTVLPIIIAAIYVVSRSPGNTIKERLLSACRPNIYEESNGHQLATANNILAQNVSIADSQTLQPPHNV